MGIQEAEKDGAGNALAEKWDVKEEVAWEVPFNQRQMVTLAEGG